MIQNIFHFGNVSRQKIIILHWHQPQWKFFNTTSKFVDVKAQHFEIHRRERSNIIEVDNS